MLLVQEFLLTHSFKDLFEAHGVNARPSNDGSKWSLNYDQLAAKSSDPLACLCRGLILRPVTPIVDENQVVGPTAIVARPMDRFFNSDDVHAAAIDWPTAVAQEKLDGTCCILYFDFVKNIWCVGTRSVPEADVSFGDDIISPLPKNTFYELFKYATNETFRNHYNAHWWGNDAFDTWVTILDKNTTYIYELTTPVNRVVVKYDDYRIVSLCARNTQTGEYVPQILGQKGCLLLPIEWPLTSLQDLTEFVNKADPAKLEGAVVVDSNWNRVKVKSKAWVLASRAKDMVTMSKRNALRAIIDGTIDGVLPLLDQSLVDYVEDMRAGLNTYCHNLDFAYNHFFKYEPDRKAYALAVQASKLWQTPFFILYGKKHAKVMDWLQHLCKTDKITDSLLDTLLEAIKENQ